MSKLRNYILVIISGTSGLTYGFGNPGLIPDLYQACHNDFEPHDGPLQEVVDRLVQIPFKFQPGQRWNCGVSFDVLGRMVEVASGKPLDVFFKEHIFEPLGMKIPVLRRSTSTPTKMI